MKSLEKYFGGWELPGKLLLSTLDADRINRSYRRTSGTTPLSTGVLCFFFILEGNLELTLDKKRIRCEKEHHNYLHILPFNILY
ncbi:MAG: hypothetical protein LUD68_04845, partial [Rikenellaceae bacterium]|nr:hypothetical protein [Rikenellaceae bacterium]